VDPVVGRRLVLGLLIGADDADDRPGGWPGCERQIGMGAVGPSRGITTSKDSANPASTTDTPTAIVTAPPKRSARSCTWRPANGPHTNTRWL